MQHRKMKQFVQLRVVPFLVAAILTVSPLSLCASAATWEGTGSLGYTYWGSVNGLPYYNQLSVSFPASTFLAGLSGRTLNGNRVKLEGVTWTSPVSIYVSGYYRNSYTSVIIEEVGDPYDPSNYEIKGYLDTGTETYGTIEEITIFTPTAPDYKTSSGISLVARIDASEGRPISDVFLRPIKECGFVKTSSADASAGVSQSKGDWVWTSARVIGAESAEELAALDNVASEITAGNDILESMKGDLVAILQDIYVEVGNIDIAAESMKNILGVIRDTVSGMTDDLANTAIATMAMVRILQTNLPNILSAIDLNGQLIAGKLDELIDLLLDESNNAASESEDKVEQGSAVQEGFNELQRPDYESIDTDVGHYVNQFDGGSGESDAALGSFMGSIFQSSMITSMLMISLTFCMVAYVLYGKR